MSSSVSLVSLKNIYNLWPPSSDVPPLFPFFSLRFGFGPECIKTFNIYLWHLHSVRNRCSSIDGRWWLSIDDGFLVSIDGGFPMSIDGGFPMSIDDGLLMSINDGLLMSIDLHVGRAGRMWVFCYKLLVSHDPHGIARCG
ncbi:hypothetical protein F2Q70_00038544 [Brassica cretica]|uniref:Uncharacterized protein n=1 Tax=Brassica cretica TaxID=69181 RepID=A0A8S9K4L3_BRACR|nr:hypothetical protein F2Q70_00038544 [Brassica cretica]